jgi:DNA-binding NarL/FixJ family response regulator
MKILIVDDHTLFREGLAHILHRLEDDVQIFEASDYDTALTVIADTADLDLMLLDLNMPGKDGFAVLEAVGKNYPTLPAAVVSASRKQSDVDRVLATSAMGYIPKDTTSQVMLCAVQMILSGGVYTPPAKQFSAIETSNSKIDNLTPRQLQVLSMMVSGSANKNIATDLNVTEATIKMHITSIFKSLGVSNRTQATLAALDMGIKPGTD